MIRDALKTINGATGLGGTLRVHAEGGNVGTIHLFLHDGKMMGQVEVTRSFGNPGGATLFVEQVDQLLAFKEAVCAALNGVTQWPLTSPRDGSEPGGDGE